MRRMPPTRSAVPSANLVLSMALNTFDVMQRNFDETWSSALGRTRMRSPSGSMTSLLAGSASWVVAILAWLWRVTGRFFLGFLLASESFVRFKDDM